MSTAIDEKKNLFANLNKKIKAEPAIEAQPLIAPVEVAKPKAKGLQTKPTNEVMFSFYLSPQRLNALKLKALNEGTSVKELINNALANYYSI